MNRPPTAGIRPQNYVLHWMALAAAALVVAASLWLRREPAIQRHVPAGEAGQFSFFIVQLPHAGSMTAGRYQKKLDEWLSALTAEGFQPMALSEALFRQRKKIPLPRGAVVLVFDEALRGTIVKAKPVIERHRAPAVLITHRKPIDNADFGYISLHELSLLVKSSLWDIAYYDPIAPDVIHFDRSAHPDLPTSRSGWNSLSTYDPHSRMLNRPDDIGALRRLSLPLAWDGRDLTRRLLAEWPAPPNSFLSIHDIAGQPFGVARSAEDGSPHRFTLATPAELRTGSLMWLSTEGIQDFKLDIDVQRRVGEVWFLLRSDRAAANGLRLGFTNEHLVLEHTAEGKILRLAEVPWDKNAPGLKASVKLQNRRLEVSSAEKRALLIFDRLPETIPANALLQMFIYDPVHGTALADDAELTLHHGDAL